MKLNIKGKNGKLIKREIKLDGKGSQRDKKASERDKKGSENSDIRIHQHT